MKRCKKLIAFLLVFLVMVGTLPTDVCAASKKGQVKDIKVTNVTTKKLVLKAKKILPTENKSNGIRKGKQQGNIFNIKQKSSNGK